MDGEEAREQLSSAGLARAAGEVPPVRWWTPPLVGIFLALGFLAVGLFPYTIWRRLAALVVALVVWGTAGWLVLYVRAKGGVRGLRGRTRSTAVVLGVCVVSLVPGVLATNPGMRWPYVILGLCCGAAMWIVIRRSVEGA